MIELQNIYKYYGKHPAINDVSISFVSGNTTALIGPSGCGKSTLIRAMVGLIKPDKGKITINGVIPDNLNIIQLRRKIGYVIQEGGLFPHLTAYDNAALMAKYLKWEKPKIVKRINELTELTKFPKEGLSKYPGQLSGGQRQRISLIRALMLDPEILMLDEPLGALDPLIRYDLQTDLKNIFALLNKTVVLVTHDLAEAVYLADEIVLMKEGKVVQEGKSIELFNNPYNEFVTKFVNAQRNRLVNN